MGKIEGKTKIWRKPWILNISRHMVTWLVDDWPRNRYSIPERAKRYFRFPKRPVRLWSPRNRLVSGHQELLPRALGYRRVMLNTYT
jgi:hypothetical protein